MRRICFVATIPAVVHAFLRGHIHAAAEKYDVTIVCNPTDKHLLNGLHGRLILLPIKRKPSPWADMLVLFQLFRMFRRERFDIVHTHMPKTSLLGMLAAWLSNVPIRINTFHGEVWAVQNGWRREALKRFDRMIALLATDIQVVGPGQKVFLENEGVLPAGKANIFGAGSICGVDTSRFYPDQEIKHTVRNDLGIEHNATVILFVGRLNRDKGMLDLAAAFETIAKYRQDVVLLLVGSEEDVPVSKIRAICCFAADRIHYVSFSSTPNRYMMAADIYCLPSYREGFNMTIIEAAACALPAVASRIHGVTDAVVDGKTGLLFPAGDVKALTSHLVKLVEKKDLRQQMGEMARRHVKELYSSEKIICETIAFYDRLIEAQGSNHDKEDHVHS